MKIYSAIVLLGGLLLSGCGYKVGPVAGESLKGISSVYVPVVLNEVYEPNLAVMVTDAIIQRFHSDGTLAVRRLEEADSICTVNVTRIERNPLRSAQSDSRVVAEYRVRLKADITFTRKSDNFNLFEKRSVTGETDFFVGRDLQEGERQALGLVAEDLAKEVVSQVTEGW